MHQRKERPTHVFLLPLMIMIIAVIHFLSCMRVVNTVPTNKELFKRYQFCEDDLKNVAFYVSNRVVLRRFDTQSRYDQWGESFDLIDKRQDDVYYIDVNTEGRYVTRDSIDQRGRMKWLPFYQKKKKEFVRVSFDIRDRGRFEIDFIENAEGYFILRRDPDGKLNLKDDKYQILDGGNCLLLVRARERDYYRGVDHQPYWDILIKSFLLFVTIFGVLYLYSEK